MTRQRSCDEHAQYAKGCAACNRRSSKYENRRWYLAQQGQRLSAASDLTRDRLRALRAAGYRLEDIAEASGANFKNLWRISEGHTAWVQLKVFHGVEAAYAELCHFPGPSSRAAAVAARRGWVPPPEMRSPEPVVDTVAIERALSGDRVPLNPAEKTAAIRWAHSQGWNVQRISAALHMNYQRVRAVIEGGEVRRQGRPSQVA